MADKLDCLADYSADYLDHLSAADLGHYLVGCSGNWSAADLDHYLVDRSGNWSAADLGRHLVDY